MQSQLRRIVRTAAVAAVAVLGFSALASSSQAQVANGSFEQFPDLTGYGATGNNTVRGTDFYSPVPNQTVQAVIQSTGNAGGAPVSAGALESFFGLTSGTLNTALGGPPATTGSGIKQTFSVAGPSTLTFSANFLTNEATTGNQDDGFFTLTPPVGAAVITSLGRPATTLANASASNQANSGLQRETGYQTFTLTLPVAGSYTLGIGVVNATDSAGNSAVLVDNIATAAGGGGVPLPAGVMLAPLAGGIALLAARRKARQTTQA